MIIGKSYCKNEIIVKKILGDQKNLFGINKNGQLYLTKASACGLIHHHELKVKVTYTACWCIFSGFWLCFRGPEISFWGTHYPTWETLNLHLFAINHHLLTQALLLSLPLGD